MRNLKLFLAVSSAFVIAVMPGCKKGGRTSSASGSLFIGALGMRAVSCSQGNSHMPGKRFQIGTKENGNVEMVYVGDKVMSVTHMRTGGHDFFDFRPKGCGRITFERDDEHYVNVDIDAKCGAIVLKVEGEDCFMPGKMP